MSARVLPKFSAADATKFLNSANFSLDRMLPSEEMTNEIIDDVLSDLAERYKHDPYLKLSVAQVVDSLLDVRSRLELVQG
jgi:hypothetical protein